MSINISGDNSNSVPRAWAVFSVTLTVLTVHASYNLTMVRTAAGVYQCRFINALPTATYVVSTQWYPVIIASSVSQAQSYTTTGFDLYTFSNGVSADGQFSNVIYSNVVIW